MYAQRIKRRLPAALALSLLAVAASVALCLTTAELPAVAASGASPAAPSPLPAQAGAAASAAPARRSNGRIAYVSRATSDPRSADIWVMNPDGSGATNLTNTPQVGESSPAWSPDGARIAFARLSGSGGDPAAAGLFVMNANGSSAARVPVASLGHSPAWSPDGAKLAYVVSTGNSSDIYVANLDGSGETNLTNSAASESNPTWSPDGAHIAFDRDPQISGGGIFIVKSAGGDERKLVDVGAVRGAHRPRWSPDGALVMFEGGAFTAPGPAPAYVVAAMGGTPTTLYPPDQPRPDIYDPAWSPDGKRIVFRNDDELNANIGVADTNGVQVVASLNAQPGIQSQPTWQPLVSAEGKIVFTSERDGNAEIYVMDSDGSNPKNLTNNPAKDATPVWSPDRTRIAFTSDRSGRSNLYVMDADGGNVRAVTNYDNTSVDYRVYDPAWSPDGAKIVFVGSFMGETSSLIVVNADGSQPRGLLEGSTEVADPAWSPDGTRIAYVGREPHSNPEDGISFHVFVINSNGTGKTRVAFSARPFSSFPYPPEGSGPAWSPDGSRIAYSLGGNTIPQINYVLASGGPPTAVTVHPSAHTQPAWSATNQIIFTSDRDGQREIYAIDADGNVDRPVSRLTQNAAADYDPNSQPGPFVPQAVASTIQWRNALFRVREGGTATGSGGGDPLVVTRLGDLTNAASVDYETTDIPACVGDSDCPRRASERSDYLRTSGTLHFAPGEASKTISVPLVDDIYVEGDQFYDLVLTNASGATLGVQATTRVTITDNDKAETPAPANPIDEPNFFVRMHYLDFLGREPEPAGQEAWVGVWNRCPDINRDERCDRVTISSAFFRSLEFQMRGGFVFRFYRVSFNRRPTYAEFVRDTARITGQTLAEIDASKNAFAAAWVRRDEFVATYFGGSQKGNDDYVARLEANTGTTLTGDVTRATLEADLSEGRRTHAGILRAVAEHPNVEAALYNEAFVTMQYFGYLKRDPEREGFENWMRVINRGDGYRVMVHGFVNSVEYRARFGRP